VPRTSVAMLLALTILFRISASAQNQNQNPGSPPQTAPATNNQFDWQHPAPPSPTATATQLEQQGDELRAHKDYIDAIDYYNAAIRRGHETAPLRNKLGMSKLLLQREDAKREFERAIKLDPNLPEAHCNLGVYWYLIKKNNRKAVKEYEIAIKLDPEHATYHKALGIAYMDQKNYEKATAEYNRAMELDPEVFERSSSSPFAVSANPMPLEERARYYFFLARMYAGRKDIERALQYLRKAKEDGYEKLKDAYDEAEFAALRKDPRFQQVMTAKDSLPQ
jgi:tetratricopeptide (TPR) repeat protein